MNDLPTPPDLNVRAFDLIEWGAKAAIALGSIKVFLAGIYKPFMEWRKEHNAKTIREVLAPELAQLQQIIHDESGCADNMQTAVRAFAEVFNDLDRFLSITIDNRERIDETNDLLNEVFHLEQRLDRDRTAEIDALLSELAERQKQRRRGLTALTEQPT